MDFVGCTLPPLPIYSAKVLSADQWAIFPCKIPATSVGYYDTAHANRAAPPYPYTALTDSHRMGVMTNRRAEKNSDASTFTPPSRSSKCLASMAFFDSNGSSDVLSLWASAIMHSRHRTVLDRHGSGGSPNSLRN